MYVTVTDSADNESCYHKLTFYRDIQKPAIKSLNTAKFVITQYLIQNKKGKIFLSVNFIKDERYLKYLKIKKK